MNDLFDSYQVDLRAPYADVHLASALTERGLALIDRVGNPSVLLSLANSIGVVVPHRDSGPGGITTLTDLGADVAVRSGFGGFTNRELDPHTDRAGLAHLAAVR